MRLPDSLTPLRDRQFRWYYAGRFVSTFGSTMVPIALSFAVLDLTGSTAALGLVLAARSIPAILLTLIGGVVSDRFSRALVMQVSHLLTMVTQGAAAALLISGHATLGLLIAIEAVNGAVSAFTMPAMYAIVPSITPRSHLQQANAMLGFLRNGLAVLGPSLGAIFVVTVGSGWALALDAVAYAVAAVCLAQIRLPRRTERATAHRTGMLTELREGWSAFTASTWLWLIVVAFGFLNAIHVGAWMTLGPALADQTDGLGAGGWGLVLSAESAGLLVMTVALMRLQLRHPLRAGMIGISLLGGSLVVAGVYPHLLPLLVMAFIAGAGMEVFGIGWQTALHEHVDDRVLSRVSAYDILGSIVAVPIGSAVFGILGEHVDLRLLMWTSGIAYTAICLATLASSSVRDLRRAES